MQGHFSMITDSDISLQRVQELSVSRLRDCVDPDTMLLMKQIRHGRWSGTLGTEAITSTAICLIGLDRSNISVTDIVGEPAQVCKRIAKRIRDQQYPGGLGLLLWANAVLKAVSFEALLNEADFCLSTLECSLPSLTTMEVAWMLSGLLHTDDRRLRKVTAVARHELQSRLAEKTLTFSHASTKAPWGHRLRAHVANFADQIYPLQALAFAAANGDSSALELAGKIAARLAASQGPMGQWWWHYHATTGEVIDEYPVYSVHQHSMAPMAFHCLSSAGGETYKAGTKGREWLYRNELGIDMIDVERGIIWRSVEIEESKVGRSIRHASALLGKAAKRHAPPLRLNKEMRPYEWGWLLYVSALENVRPMSEHIT
jgi:uncharacterized membrane protein YciS (DUF1049 family)